MKTEKKIRTILYLLIVALLYLFASTLEYNWSQEEAELERIARDNDMQDDF